MFDENGEKYQDRQKGADSGGTVILSTIINIVIWIIKATLFIPILLIKLGLILVKYISSILAVILLGTTIIMIGVFLIPGADAPFRLIEIGYAVILFILLSLFTELTDSVANWLNTPLGMVSPSSNRRTSPDSSTDDGSPENPVTDETERSGDVNSEIDLTDVQVDIEQSANDSTDPVFDIPTETGDSDSSRDATGRTPTEAESDHDERESKSTTDIELSEMEYGWSADVGITFADIGGMEPLKTEIRRDVIEPFTTKREQARKLRIPIPNILFYGPPGTGKTYFAQAISGELGFPFVKLSGGDVTSKWINDSTNKITKLFHEAEVVAGECNGAVIFLDEIDSVLKHRGGESHNEDDKAVNELLNRLEDTNDIDADVLFIGATNRYDKLDTAGIRAGRIDKEIEIGKPDQDAREAIFAAQLDDRPHKLTPEMIRECARHTDGYVAADIEGIVTDAARKALHDGEGTIYPRHIEKALRSSTPSVGDNEY